MRHLIRPSSAGSARVGAARQSPFRAVILTALVYLALLCARFWGGFHPADLIMLGNQWCDPTQLPAGVAPNLPDPPSGRAAQAPLGSTRPGKAGSAPAARPVAGFDGQFWYRLALDPWTDRVTDYGITLDFPAHRQQRILYPALAWMVAGGRAEAVPMALLAVNFVGLCALAALGGAWARRGGLSPLWGCLVSLYPGFLLTLVLDCTEIVASALVLASLLALDGGRARLGAVLLAAAVLARETSVVMAVAAVLYGLTSGRRPVAAAGAVGLAVYAAWQGVLALRWGHLPSSETAQINLGFPLMGYFAELGLHPDGTALVTMAWYALMVGIWLWAWRTAPPGVSLEKCALAGFLLLTTLFTTFIWSGTISAMRQLADCSVLGACLAMRGGPRPRAAALMMSLLYWAALAEQYTGFSRLPWFR